MKEKKLYSISLISFLIGLFLLLFISEKTDISESNIAALDYTQENQRVKIKGIAYSIKNLENTMLLNVKDKTGNITVVAFNAKNIDIKENSILEVEGELAIYKNKKEIVASKIKIF